MKTPTILYDKNVITIQQLLMQLKCVKHGLHVSVRPGHSNVSYSCCCERLEEEAKIIVDAITLHGHDYGIKVFHDIERKRQMDKSGALRLIEKSGYNVMEKLVAPVRENKN